MVEKTEKPVESPEKPAVRKVPVAAAQTRGQVAEVTGVGEHEQGPSRTVRMKLDISGTRNGKPWPRRGYTVELPEDEANDLVATGSAAHVGDEDVEENAAVDTYPGNARSGGLTKASLAGDDDPAV